MGDLFFLYSRWWFCLFVLWGVTFQNLLFNTHCTRSEYQNSQDVVNHNIAYLVAVCSLRLLRSLLCPIHTNVWSCGISRTPHLLLHRMDKRGRKL